MKASWTGGAAIAALCASACLAASPAAATEWLVNATFDDGTTLTGTFVVNAYGYLQSANLQTDTKGVFTGFDYTVADSYVASDGVDSPSYIDFQPGYQSDLRIEFADALTVGSPDNPIVTDDASYECQGSFSCYDLGGGNTRYIDSGFATEVPEPAIWALILTGFAGLGAALRGRRRRELPAA
ncbi:MAG: PEP-CTERM sorting domain-containing protein [Caulobacteraceae bacterium]